MSAQHNNIVGAQLGAASAVTITNAEFMSALFQNLNSELRISTAMFVGDPGTVAPKEWSGRPSLPAAVKDKGDENSYFCPSALKKTNGKPGQVAHHRRVKAGFAGLYILGLDDIKDPNALPLPPTYVLETSAGNHQVGYRLGEPCMDIGMVDALHAALKGKGYCDASGNNPVRWLRLPVGRNCKPTKMFDHKLVVWNPEVSYTVDQLVEGLSLDITAPAAPDVKPINPVVIEQSGAISRNEQAWRDDIRTNVSYHDPMLRIAALHIGRDGGDTAPAVKHLLHHLLNTSEVATRKPTHEERYAQIDAIVDSAVEKFGQDPFPPLDSPERRHTTYVTLNEWHAGRGPGTYFCYQKADGGEQVAFDIQFAGPIVRTARTIGAGGNDSGIQIKFTTQGGRQREWTMPRALLFGEPAALFGTLADMDLFIRNKASDHLIGFLKQHSGSLPEVECATKLGWHGGAYILPDTVLGCSPGSIVFQTEHPEAARFHKTGGTLDGWKDGVGRYASSNKHLIHAISAAFAGPLLRPLGREGGGFHYVGPSSIGKTTALHAAVSVWGQPVDAGGQGALRSWNSTANGMEGAAVLSNDGLLAMDEIGQCDPKQIGQMVYSVSNGLGKQRAARTGGAKSVASWLTMMLSTGELSIEQAMATAGQVMHAGQEVRIISTPILAAHGLFDNLHEFALVDNTMQAARNLSEAIKAECAANHGHAGREFVAKLIESKVDLGARLAAIMPTFQFEGGSALAGRAGTRFAITALAGELAVEFGIVPWAAGTATAASVALFKQWGEACGIVESEERKTIEAFRAYIGKHGGNRFEPVGNTAGARAIVERDGWCESPISDFVDEVNALAATRYLFLPAAFNKVIASAGVNRTSAIKALVKHGVIPAGGCDAKHLHQEKPRINGDRQLVYPVNMAKLADADI